jgi:hypothetical protein
VIAAVFIFSRFEIFEDEKWTPPSREFQSNNFYVLGEWLSSNGRPVRFYPRWTGLGALSPQDGGLFIQASLFDRDQEGILAWVREGGVLVVSVDFPWYRGDGEGEIPPAVLALERFLGELDIRIRRPLREEAARDDGEEAPGGNNGETDGETGAAGKAPGSIAGGENAGEEDFFAAENEHGGGEGDGGPDESRDFPEYDYSIIFEEPGFVSEDSEDSGAGGGFLTLRDSEGNVRLIRRPLGKGLVAVAGSCIFMYNYRLEDEPNARLAWELTGGSLGPGRPGFLFVRGRRSTGGLLGILGARGNLVPPILSALVLIFTGFWMVLPGFGVFPGEESRRPLSITGRFSAEARFLRRYNALEAYLEIYLRELRRRGRTLGRELEEVEEALAAGKKIGRVKTAVYLKNLMSALERI